MLLFLWDIHLCSGIQTPDPGKAMNLQKHVISKTLIILSIEARSTLHQDSFYHSNYCDMLVPASQPSTTCKNCQKQNVIVNSEINRKQANLQIPAEVECTNKIYLSLKE